MKLRIAHITATFPPYRGGTGNVCYYSARELARSGHDVHVFTASADVRTSYELREGFSLHRLRPVLQVGNAPVLPSLLWKLKGFDIIHLHFPFIVGAEIARGASIVYRTPMVVSFHNDLIGDGARAPLFAFYQRISASVTVRHAARLCGVSMDHYRSSCLRGSLAGAEPPVVELPNGVDVHCFNPHGSRGEIRSRYRIPGNARLVLFAAALDRAHHFKGLRTLLSALRHLPSDAWLLVVGDGELRQVYQREAVRLGLAERVIFAGAVDHHALPPFFRDADLTALPSSPPESFGLVLIESLACGTPVVASNIPGVRTVVEHEADGLLVEPGDPSQLARALERILYDDVRRARMGQQGRSKIEMRYSWQQIGLQLESLYRQVMCEERTRPQRSIQGHS